MFAIIITVDVFVINFTVKVVVSRDEKSCKLWFLPQTSLKIHGRETITLVYMPRPDTHSNSRLRGTFILQGGSKIVLTTSLLDVFPFS